MLITTQKQHTLIFTPAMWGYLQDMFSMGQETSHNEVDGHRYHTDIGAGRLYPGEASLYGRIRPWPENMDSTPSIERRCEQDWQKMGLEDYYITMAEGMRDGRPIASRDIHSSPFYPERLFVQGEDGDGGGLPRCVLLEHLRSLGVRAHHGFWEPVITWRGYSGGYPTWRQGLRAATSTGPTWSEVQRKLDVKDLPDGYTWDFYPGAFEGRLYYEGESR